MYNENNKTSFIQNIGGSSNGKNANVVRFFNDSESFEKSIGKDIYDMSPNEIKYMISGMKKYQTGGEKTYFRIIDAYIEHLKSHDVKHNDASIYNYDLKTNFITSYTQNTNTEKAILRIFKKTKAEEEAANSDVCAMNLQELQYTLDKILSYNQNSMWLEITIIRAYCNWCISSGVSGANMNINLYERKEFCSVRDSRFYSPSHLLKYIDAVFGKEYNKDNCIYFRCLLWLAFSGIELCDFDNIDNIYISDDYSYISLGSKTVKIPQESTRDFIAAKQYIKQEELHENYKKYNHKYISSTLSKKIKKAFDCNKVLNKVSYTDIFLSGMCYRIYEAEMAYKFPVTEADVKNYIKINNREYDMWKVSFCL